MSSIAFHCLRHPHPGATIRGVLPPVFARHGVGLRAEQDSELALHLGASHWLLVVQPVLNIGSLIEFVVGCWRFASYES